MNEPDPLSIGRKIRHFRKQAGLTLEELGQKVGRAASRVSAIETGKHEPSVSQLSAIAAALGVKTTDLLDPTPATHREELELELERAQKNPIYQSLGLPQVRTKSLPLDALTALTGMHRGIKDMMNRRAATPEEARRANRELRESMKGKGNYFPDLEKTATSLLAKVDYSDGPLSWAAAADMAKTLGFTLHYVSDLPSSTRSVSDTKNRRIYLANEDVTAHDPRSHLLTALAGHVLGHQPPKDYSDFLTQRVEANYLAAALLLPQKVAVAGLKQAKKNKEISIEWLRDKFGVSYETAAHRFTNLATEHLELPVHFMKVHISGTIHKMYSNDGLPFPTDPLGSVEGQYACKRFTSRTVFNVDDRFSPYFQYTDTPKGSFWCTARVLPGNDFAVSVGVPYAHVRWFTGRDTTQRSQSLCPNPQCCRQPPAALERKWADASWPTARTHASLLAAVPPGIFPGVDDTEVYRFLERHAPE